MATKKKRKPASVASLIAGVHIDRFLASVRSELPDLAEAEALAALADIVSARHAEAMGIDLADYYTDRAVDFDPRSVAVGTEHLRGHT